MKRTVAACAAVAALAASLVVPTSAAADPIEGFGPPNCTQGQLQAAAAQFNGAKNNFGQAIKHGLMGTACFFSVPPGEVVN